MYGPPRGYGNNYNPKQPVPHPHQMHAPYPNGNQPHHMMGNTYPGAMGHNNANYNGYSQGVQHFNPARPNVPYNPALMTNYSPNFTINNPTSNQYNAYNYPHANAYPTHFSQTNIQPNVPLSTEGGETGHHLLERIKADAKTIFTKPGRDTRPGKIVVIMRGLPGSGKTHFAKVLKDYEAKYDGASPRIFCVDDYYMSEVDKEEEDPETGIKRKVKGLEYKFEEEMEEAYGASLFKAFRKCLTEGFFSFIIVDNINTHVRDFEQYCIAAMSAGYEVYILQTPPSDLKLLAQRNVHKRTLEEIQKMDNEWEETPYRYTVLNVDKLDNPSMDEITVVEMQEEDSESDEVEEVDKSVVESKWTKLQVEPPEEKRKEKHKYKDKDKQKEKVKEKENEKENEKEKEEEKEEEKEIEKEKAQDKEGEQDEGYDDTETEIFLGIDKGKAPQKPLQSIIKQSSGIEELHSAYATKKVRWADIEFQKELERSASIKRKRLDENEAEDEDEDSANVVTKKPSSFLDTVREEQEKFKVNLVAKQALEQVRYIGPKETLGEFE